MKIVHTTPNFLPRIGGLELDVYRQSKELVKLGHKVTIITPNAERSFRKIDGIKIKELPVFFNIQTAPISLGFEKAILNEKPDIVHTHSSLPYTCDISILKSKKNNIPTVLKFHNEVSGKNLIEKIGATLYNYTMFNNTLKLVDRIIINSKLQITSFPLLRKYKNKIKVIPPGLDDKFLSQNYIEPKKNHVLFVGSLRKNHWHKGIKILIKSIKDVKKEIPNIKLDIIGEGNAKIGYQKLSKNLRLQNNIEFHGKKDTNELIEFYKTASVIILPSINAREGFGTVLAEALSIYRPIITTDVVGFAPKIIKNNLGKVIRPNNLEELSISIKSLIKDHNLCKKIGKNGFRYVNKHLTYKKISKDIESLYKKVLTNY